MIALSPLRRLVKPCPAVLALAVSLSMIWVPARADLVGMMEIELAPVAGYALTRPWLGDDARGAVVRGRIRSRPSALPLRTLRVERLAPDGRTISEATAHIYRPAVRHTEECARFAARTDWQLTAIDRLRVGPPLGRQDAAPISPASSGG